MKRKQAIEFVTKELHNLDIYNLNNEAVKHIVENAVELSEIATKQEVAKYIYEAVELLGVYGLALREEPME